MNQEDFKQFANAIGTLGEIHNRELSPMLISAYFKALEKFEINQVMEIISRSINESTFFPKPHELIEMISGKRGSLDDIALVEADKVINAMRQVGSYQSVVFDDPVTMAVISKGYGGWIRMVQDSLESDNKWFRVGFCKIYRAYHNQGIREYGKMIGIHEDSNAQRGLLENIPEPVLIGDQEKALQISAKGKPEIAYHPKLRKIAARIG